MDTRPKSKQTLIQEDRLPGHQGELLFEGNRRGAVFTVILPPFTGRRSAPAFESLLEYDRRG